ncbi:MAG: SH3 domain-containing protein [Nonlabens sp.]
MKKSKLLLCFCVFLAFAKALPAQSSRPVCKFVNAKGGLKLRLDPKKDSEVLRILPYGTQVLLQPTDVDFPDQVLDDNKVINGRWVRVKTLFGGYDLPNAEIGFVFDYYLSDHLDTIPDSSIHNFVEINIHQENSNEQIEGVSPRENFHQNGLGCEIRYEFNPAAKQALKNIVQFKVVDFKEYKNEILGNNYSLDTSFKPRRFPIPDQIKAAEGYTQYYLPINNGRDSTLVKDDTGEWGSITEYLGYIKNLDSYFVTGFAEDQEIVRIDQITGERSPFARGNFSISPKGTFKISVYSEIFDELTAFSLAYMSMQGAGYEIRFSSWFPVGEVNWISERKFLVPVAPMDQRRERLKNFEPIYLLGEIKI